MWNLLLKILKSRKNEAPSDMFLIAGLGNIGAEYADTRHNIGFRVVDKLAADAGATWEDRRYGFVTTIRVKNQQLLLLKPSTYMNLSGNAVRYWMQKENIAPERLLIIVDDLSLPVATLRLKPQGGAGGHNGLKDIERVLGNANYARLRVGIGGDFPRGTQVDFVLGRFSADDEAAIKAAEATVVETAKTFCLSGIDFTMNHFNKRKG